MAFASVPLYLDHPNWHQFQDPNPQQGSAGENPQLQPLQPPPPSQVGGGGGSIRPGSMVDRARLANLPLPEAGLKCPRCDSTNTKFCYFNNYSLTQPRHFCKTCRRYWTRGGALRNVPVGGGCRRNKRSKSSGSKSSVSADRQTGSNSTSAGANSSGCGPEMTQLPFTGSLQNLTQYGGHNIGSNIQPQTEMGFRVGLNPAGNSNIFAAGVADQWRLSFLAGFEPPSGILTYHQSEGLEAAPSMVGDNQLTSSGASQLSSVKVEENRGLNLSRQFFGISDNNQYWPGGNTWTGPGFSGLNSSSTSHHL